MEFYFNFASTSPSIAMIGALLSFAGVGLLILILSERMFHGLSKLIYFFGNQILISRRLFSTKYIEENKASNNQLYIKQTDITPQKTAKPIKLGMMPPTISNSLKISIYLY